MQNINNNPTVSYQAQPYQANTVSAIREQSAQPSSQGKGVKNGIARRNSQMNERDAGSIGRVSGALNSGGQGAYKGQQSGMNIGNFDDFDQYSNGNNGGNQYDHGFDPPTKLDSGRGVSSGFNKNSAVDGFPLPHHHMFDIEEDNEDQFNDQYAVE